jgi:hypothetical protein
MTDVGDTTVICISFLRSFLPVNFYGSQGNQHIRFQAQTVTSNNPNGIVMNIVKWSFLAPRSPRPRRDLRLLRFILHGRRLRTNSSPGARSWYRRYRSFS